MSISTLLLENTSRKIIDWSLIAIVFFVPVYFAWFHEDYSVFDLNKSVAIHLFLTIILIAWLIRSAVSGRFKNIGSKWLFLFWLASLATVIVSSLLSLHPTTSWLGTYERQQGAHNLLAYLLFFVFLLIVLRDKFQLYRFIIAAHISSLLICLYGLLQHSNLDFLRWSESSAGRIFSSFGQPNFFGHYLAVMLPLTLYAIFFIARRPLTQIFFIAVGILETVCLIFTYSRSAWLALVLSAVLTCVVVLWQKNKRSLALVLVGFILAFGIVIFSPAIQNYVSNVDYNKLTVFHRAISAVDFNGGSNAIRLRYWRAGVKIFGKAPLERKVFGFGPDVEASIFVHEYKSDWGYYERLNSFPDRAHNALLDILLQFGLFGLIAFGSLIGFVIFRFCRRLKKLSGSDYWLAVSIGTALLAYGINNLFSFSLTGMAVIFYFLLACAWRIGQGFAPMSEHSLNFFHSWSRYAIAIVATILLVILFYAYDARSLIADYHYMKVKKAETRQDCRVVVQEMETVLAWYSESEYYARAYLFHNTNCLSAASGEAKIKLSQNILDQAENLQTSNEFYTLTDLAHAYSILGFYVDVKYYAAAEDYYRQLLTINPFITLTYQDYGRMKLWQKKYAQARALFEQGIAALPDLTKAELGSEHTATLKQQFDYFKELIVLTNKSE